MRCKYYMGLLHPVPVSCEPEVLEKIFCFNFDKQLRRQINLSARKGRRNLAPRRLRGYCQMGGSGKGLHAEVSRNVGNKLSTNAVYHSTRTKSPFAPRAKAWNHKLPAVSRLILYRFYSLRSWICNEQVSTKRRQQTATRFILRIFFPGM